MTRPVHPCTFPHVLGHAQKQREEPKVEAEDRNPGDWTDEEIAEFAAKDFGPGDRSECPLPTNQEWIDSINPYLISLRFEWAAMGETKAELIEMVEQLDAADAFKPLLDGISDTERQMRGFHDLASAAGARLMCAATVVALKREGRHG